MAYKLAMEIIDASNGTGGAVKNVRILTKWPKQIKHLLIIDGRRVNYGKRCLN